MCIFATANVRTIMLTNPPLKIIRLAYIEPSLRIFEYVNMEHIIFRKKKALQRSLQGLHNSPSRIRTYDLAVNSRSLYRLSYRGIKISLKPKVLS